MVQIDHEMFLNAYHNTITYQEQLRKGLLI